MVRKTVGVLEGLDVGAQARDRCAQLVAGVGDELALGLDRLLEDAPRNADVIAETPLTLMVLSGAALRELEREFPRLARKLSRSIEQRRRWLEPVG